MSIGEGREPSQDNVAEQRQRNKNVAKFQARKGIEKWVEVREPSNCAIENIAIRCERCSRSKESGMEKQGKTLRRGKGEGFGKTRPETRRVLPIACGACLVAEMRSAFDERRVQTLRVGEVARDS